MSEVQPIKVKCPVCESILLIPSSRRGERVACEQCGSKIKVPGVAATAGDDDDWLKLETDLTSASTDAAGPARAADAAGPADADDDDEFMIPAEPPTRSTGGVTGRGGSAGGKPVDPPPLSSSDLDALAGFANDDDQQAAPMKRVEAKPSADDSFRVRCPVCESVTYAKVAQVGKRIRCPDCHSAIVVPPPQRAKPKYKPDLEAAATYAFSDGDGDQLPARVSDPFRKSADDLLRAAEAAEDDSEEEEWELPAFGAWFSGLGRVFVDPAVAVHILLLSLLAFIPAAIALSVEHESRVVVLGMFAGGAVFGALVLACGFAILQSVANGEERVSDWPVFDPMEWFGQLIVVISAVAVSAGPIWMVAHFLFPGGLLTVALTMLSLYALFPVVLMSMLDEQSVMVPFSTDVSKSIVRSPDQWGAAYLASAVLFFAMFLCFMIASVCPPKTGALLAIVVTVSGVFAYFGIIGRLAFAIGHAVNAPPMVNDIERERERERKATASADADQ